MNLVQLRRLVDAVEQGSLSEAARRHGVSVQAVSKSVADLERELGRPVLVRVAQGVVPTAYGRMLCSRAAPLLGAFDDLALFAAGPGEESAPSESGMGASALRNEEAELHRKEG